MGTLINGIKEIFASASQNSPTNIPTCASDGTPNGNITIANLASVLGGKSTELYNGVDFDTLVDGKNYFGYGTVFANSSNTPNTTARTFKLFVNKDTSESYIIQTCLMYSGELFVRTRNNDGIWISWHTIAIDYPSFYKNYNDLLSLASAIGGLMYIGNREDANVIGTYFTSTGSLNNKHFPSDNQWWTLISIGDNMKKLCFQIAFDQSGDAYFRSYWNGWKSWRAL